MNFNGNPNVPPPQLQQQQQQQFTSNPQNPAQTTALQAAHARARQFQLQQLQLQHQQQQSANPQQDQHSGPSDLSGGQPGQPQQPPLISVQQQQIQLNQRLQVLKRQGLVDDDRRSVIDRFFKFFSQNSQQNVPRELFFRKAQEMEIKLIQQATSREHYLEETNRVLMRYQQHLQHQRQAQIFQNQQNRSMNMPNGSIPPPPTQGAINGQNFVPSSASVDQPSQQNLQHGNLPKSSIAENASSTFISPNMPGQNGQPGQQGQPGQPAPNTFPNANNIPVPQSRITQAQLQQAMATYGPKIFEAIAARNNGKLPENANEMVARHILTNYHRINQLAANPAPNNANNASNNVSGTPNNNSNQQGIVSTPGGVNGVSNNSANPGVNPTPNSVPPPLTLNKNSLQEIYNKFQNNAPIVAKYAQHINVSLPAGINTLSELKMAISNGIIQGATPGITQLRNVCEKVIEQMSSQHIQRLIAARQNQASQAANGVNGINGPNGVNGTPVTGNNTLTAPNGTTGTAGNFGTALPNQTKSPLVPQPPLMSAQNQAQTQEMQLQSQAGGVVPASVASAALASNSTPASASSSSAQGNFGAVNEQGQHNLGGISMSPHAMYSNLQQQQQPSQMQTISNPQLFASPNTMDSVQLHKPQPVLASPSVQNFNIVDQAQQQKGPAPAIHATSALPGNAINSTTAANNTTGTTPQNSNHHQVLSNDSPMNQQQQLQQQQLQQAQQIQDRLNRLAQFANANPFPLSDLTTSLSNDEKSQIMNFRNVIYSSLIPMARNQRQIALICLKSDPAKVVLFFKLQFKAKKLIAGLEANKFFGNLAVFKNTQAEIMRFLNDVSILHKQAQSSGQGIQNGQNALIAQDGQVIQNAQQQIQQGMQQQQQQSGPNQLLATQQQSSPVQTRNNVQNQLFPPNASQQNNNTNNNINNNGIPNGRSPLMGRNGVQQQQQHLQQQQQIQQHQQQRLQIQHQQQIQQQQQAQRRASQAQTNSPMMNNAATTTAASTKLLPRQVSQPPPPSSPAVGNGPSNTLNVNSNNANSSINNDSNAQKKRRALSIQPNSNVGPNNTGTKLPAAEAIHANGNTPSNPLSSSSPTTSISNTNTNGNNNANPGSNPNINANPNGNHPTIVFNHGNKHPMSPANVAQYFGPGITQEQLKLPLGRKRKSSVQLTSVANNNKTQNQGNSGVGSGASSAKKQQLQNQNQNSNNTTPKSRVPSSASLDSVFVATPSPSSVATNSSAARRSANNNNNANNNKNVNEPIAIKRQRLSNASPSQANMSNMSNTPNASNMPNTPNMSNMSAISPSVGRPEMRTGSADMMKHSANAMRNSTVSPLTKPLIPLDRVAAATGVNTDNMSMGMANATTVPAMVTTTGPANSMSPVNPINSMNSTNLQKRKSVDFFIEGLGKVLGIDEDHVGKVIDSNIEQLESVVEAFVDQEATVAPGKVTNGGNAGNGGMGSFDGMNDDVFGLSSAGALNNSSSFSSFDNNSSNNNNVNNSNNNNYNSNNALDEEDELMKLFTGESFEYGSSNDQPLDNLGQDGTIANTTSGSGPDPANSNQSSTSATNAGPTSTTTGATPTSNPNQNSTGSSSNSTGNWNGPVSAATIRDVFKSLEVTKTVEVNLLTPPEDGLNSEAGRKKAAAAALEKQKLMLQQQSQQGQQGQQEQQGQSSQGQQAQQDQQQQQQQSEDVTKVLGLKSEKKFEIQKPKEEILLAWPTANDTNTNAKGNGNHLVITTDIKVNNDNNNPTNTNTNNTNSNNGNNTVDNNKNNSINNNGTAIPASSSSSAVDNDISMNFDNDTFGLAFDDNGANSWDFDLFSQFVDDTDLAI